jgi:hypothetical protein
VAEEVSRVPIGGCELLFFLPHTARFHEHVRRAQTARPGGSHNGRVAAYGDRLAETVVRGPVGSHEYVFLGPSVDRTYKDVRRAGIGLDALFDETTDEALTRLFEVNVIGVFRTIRPFLRPMIDRGSGRFVIVSSIVGKRGVPHYAGYSASKFALHGAADALRSELWGSGVSVGLVCPSSTETEFRQHALSAGPTQNSMRLVRRPARTVACAIVSRADSRRRERILGLESKAMTFLDTLVPGLIDWLLARALTRRRR